MRYYQKARALPTIIRRLYSSKVLAEQSRFQFVSANTTHLDDIVKFLGKHHYSQVPTINCFQDVDFNKVSEDLREDTYIQLKDGLSFIIQDTTKDEMVGVAIYHYLSLDLAEHYAVLAEKFKKNDTYYHWKLLQALYDKVDIYKMFNVPSIIHVRMYCLAPEAQNLGLNKGYAEATRKMAIKGLLEIGGNEVVISGEANGFYSNKLMNRCGYPELKRLYYTNFHLDNENPFRQVAETTPHTFLTLRGGPFKREVLGQ